MDRFSFELLFESLCQRLKETDNLDIVSRNFFQKTSDHERVSFLLQMDALQDHLQLPNDVQAIVDAGKKSHKLATRLRNEGNSFFRGKNYIQAVYKYTESLAYAPLTDGENSSLEDSAASLAFANRSAALFQLKKYHICLSDIAHAFSLNYPKTLAYKLYHRKGYCLQSIGQQSEAALSFSSALDFLEFCEIEDSKRQQWCKDLTRQIEVCKNENVSDRTTSANLDEVSQDAPKLSEHKMHAQYESLTDICDVANDPVLGRHIVAKQDVLPGDVILIEKPYASVMLPDSRLDHCSHCYKFTLAPQPCPSCCHSLYCSEECRSLAYQRYHRIECPLGEILAKSGVDKFALLAVRTLVVTTNNVVWKCSMVEDVDQGKNGNCGNPDAVNVGTYRSNSYEGICGLVTHAEHRTAHDLFRRAAIAVFLLRCLCFTEYFQTENPPFDILCSVGGLLLSHLQSFPCNAHEIAEFDLDPAAVATSVPHELGAGIYVTLSLFNHSCDPAVTRNFYGDLCVVRAIRSVRTGEELSDNYGAVFAMQCRPERRGKLQPQYFFECQCTACIEDWPLFSVLRETGPKFRCSSCHAAVQPHNTACHKCDSKIDIPEYRQRLRKSNTAFKVAFDKLLESKVKEALPELLNHLKVMDELLCPPCADYGACQEAVKQCFSIMANCRCLK